MIQFVNAKINLGLKIVGKRSDGYHNLSTVFYPVGVYAGSPSDGGRLADVIEVNISQKDKIVLAGMPIDCDTEHNLVYKALNIYRKQVPDLPSVEIYLEKHIPSQAGLGGGSADASFTLLSLNALVGNLLSKEVLMNMASELGADCPFFIYNRPCLASGIGDILTPIEIDLSGKWVAIVKPAVSISTREAFQHVIPCQPEIPLQEIMTLPITEWKDVLINDFESSMFARHPDLCKIKQCLYDKGALYVSMTGSGSAFYGIFPTSDTASAAIKDLPFEYTTVAKL